MSLTQKLGIILLLSARTPEASREFERFSDEQAKRFRDLENQAANYSKAGGRLMTTGAIALAPILDSIMGASKLQDEVLKIAEITGDKLGTEAFDDLQHLTIDIGKQANRSAVDMAKMMTVLADRVPKDNLEHVSKHVAQVSRAFRMAPEEAASSFTSLIERFQLTEDQAIKTYDQIAKITEQFGGSSSNVLSFLDSGGAAQAKQMGMNPTEMVAMANSLRQLGGDAGQAQRNILRLTNELDKAGKIKETFEAAGGGAEGFVAIMERAKSSGDADKWFRMSGVRGRASSYFAELANRMDDEGGLRAQLDFIMNANVDGSVFALMEEQNKSLGEQLLKLKNTVVVLGTRIGTSLMPVVLALAERMIPIVDAVAEWIDRNRKLMASIAGVVAIAGSLLILAGIGAKIVGFVKGIGATIMFVGKAMTFSPSLILEYAPLLHIYS